jgi:arginine N-succinyltransferase
MLVIRPVRHDDIDQLLALAGLSTFGLTTLPKNRKLLEQRVHDSLRGFEKVEGEQPRGESYLFVMEDSDTGKVIGTSGIVSKVGGFLPFYAYSIETTVHESKMLNVRKEIPTLHLVMEHNGPCEIGSLFMHPDYRRGGSGRTISLARFLFVAEYPDFFDPEVIAEMRGVVDEQGRSAFWDALGKHFFDLEYPKSDYLSVVNKEFIGDLMPRHSIYIPLLPKEAQEVVGKVHKNTEPAVKILESEGFCFHNMVDIFDAGPIMSCPRDEIRTARESIKAPVAQITNEPIDSPRYVISNARREFRACQCSLAFDRDGGVILTLPVAEALNANVGDNVRYATLRPEKKRQP